MSYRNQWPTNRLLSTAARLVEHAWNEELASLGVTHAGVMALDVLHSKGSMTQAQLAQEVRVQAQTMGKTLHRLEAHGVPRRRAGSVMRSIREELGPLALLEKPQYVTDGTELFRKHPEGLTRVRDGQEAFAPVLDGFLGRVHLDKHGRVVEYTPEVLDFLSVNPLFNGGGLSHTATRVPVSSVVGSLAAGETPSYVADNFRMPVEHVEAIDDRRDWAVLASA